jgi:lysophospholipase L1-like esterase
MLFSLVLALGFGSSPCQAVVPTIRIWPVGDSITEGCCLTYGGAYRTELYQLLTSAGYNVDFVGSLQDANPPPNLPDTDMEGHDGFRIDEINAGIQGWFSAIDDPDVVLLHIGTNDAVQDDDMVNAPNRLQALIGQIATLCPQAKIIVASLICAGASKQTWDSQLAEPIIETFNLSVPGVVNDEVSLGRQVYFTDMHKALTTNDLSDPVNGLHPSSTGYAKMATNWFGVLTTLVGPYGSPNPPSVLRVNGQADLQHVVVTFSKPVADTATTLSDYSLSGGASILKAALDSSLRVVTLTTTPQTANASYTLTINNVQDRTSPPHTIAANTQANLQSGPVAEGVNYTLVYSLKIPNDADYSAGVPYDIDNHASTGPFGRIAYFLQFEPIGAAPQYVWVSMNAFTTDPSKIGVPTIQSGGFFMQYLANMNVHSTVPGVVNGDGLSGGNIEFCWGNYSKVNGNNIPGASDTLYDFGDSASSSDPVGYGSMQIHNWSAAQTIFAFNDWNDNTGTSIFDLGIGNYSGTYPDWTFASNATNYQSKLLQVYVQPVRTLTVNSSNPNSGVSVTASPADNNSQSSGSTSFPLSYNNGTAVKLTAPPTAGGDYFQKWQKDGVDFSTSTSASVAMSGDHSLTAFYVNNPPIVRTLTVASSNPGSGVTITVSVTANGGGRNGTTQFARAYDDGTTVTLTALPTAGGNYFWKWQQNGVDFSTSRNATVLMNGNHTLTAVYVATQPVVQTLKVASVAPSTGVPIIVSVMANGGALNGTTQFSRSYNNGVTVTLTAPTSAGGNSFQKWQKDGVDLTTSTSATVTMDANHTLTAVY